jgi:hypothetical protein
VTGWSFLTSHARCCRASPATRARGCATSRPVLDITGRSARGIVTDLAEAGYVIRQKDGRRNRYQIQARLPLPGTATQQPAIGEVPAHRAGAGARLQPTGPGAG